MVNGQFSKYMSFRAIKFMTLTFVLIVLVAGLGIWYAERPVRSLKLDTTQLEVRVLLRNLEIPWDMDWSGDGWIWFSEKKGRISRFSPESGELQEIHFIEEVHQSPDNSGLHALALHPEFPKVPYVYVHYTYAPDKGRFVRFSFDSSTGLLEERTVLLDELPASFTHNGSRIVFSPDHKHLYLSLGDALHAESAQDLNEFSGKILRLNVDGSIPVDNPFPDSPIWSYGHRNPQGLVLASNGHLYSSEHGRSDDDELNLIKKGKNYGYPNVQGFCDSREEEDYCRRHEAKVPLKVWSPTFAVSGIAYYDHAAIPEWQNSILITSLKNSRVKAGKRLQMLRLNKEGDKIIGTTDYLVNTFGRLREVMTTPDGRIFIFTSNRELNSNGPRFPYPGDDKLIMLQRK